MLYIEREGSPEERGTPQSTKSIGSAKNVTIDNNPTPKKIGSILETRNWVQKRKVAKPREPAHTSANSSLKNACSLVFQILALGYAHQGILYQSH